MQAPASTAAREMTRVESVTVHLPGGAERVFPGKDLKLVSGAPFGGNAVAGIFQAEIHTIDGRIHCFVGGVVEIVRVPSLIAVPVPAGSI